VATGTPSSGHAGGGQWVIAHAACPGMMHRSPGEESQDAGACFAVCPPRGSPVLFAAVSDGAGSMPNSGTGSRLAVAAGLSMLVRVMRRHGPGLNELCAGMGNALRAARAAIRAAAFREQAELAEYSCTLAMVVATKAGAAVGQVGDGGVVIARRARPPEVVLWPDKGEYVNETAFVTDESAFADLHARVIPGPIEGIALFTDGLEPVALDLAERQAFPGFFGPLFENLRGARGEERASLSDELAAWLAEERFDRASPDDRTLVLAVPVGFARRRVDLGKRAGAGVPGRAA